MKLGIVVGHTRTRPGAFSPTLNSAEYPWNRDLAEIIEGSASGSLEVRTFFRDNVRISGACRQSDAWGSDMTVELHFNSSHSVSSTGTGVLYLAGSRRGKAFAAELRRTIGDVLRLPDWPSGTGGVVTPFQASGRQERGRGSLSAGRAPAALMEPFFGSNPGDCRVAARNKRALAGAILDAASAVR